MTDWAGDFADFLDETVTLEAYLGTGARGPSWAAPVQVGSVSVDDSSTLTRGPDGSLTSATAQIMLAADRIDFPVGSKVTLPSGRRVTVIRQSIQNQGALGWRYQQVTCG